MKITKTDQKLFLKALKFAEVEKDVESAYRQIFEKYYGGNFTSPYGCDGYLEPDKGNLLAGLGTSLRLLVEAKWQKNFNDGDRFKLIAQAIYYLKKFQDDGVPLPNVIVGGDENEIFTIYAPKLYKYLGENYDWNIAPSSAYTNERLYRALLEDQNVQDIFVFRIDTGFDVNEVFQAVNALRDIGEFKKLRVDEANLRKVFDEFVRLVFGGDSWLSGVKKIGAPEAVSIFIQSILGNDDIYIHPNKPNILVSGQKEIAIKGAAYNAFFSRYDRQYTVTEINTITAVADQLIEEIERRFHGDFWTPTIWADEAIKMIAEDLGTNWRDEYVVWDPAAGTKNLTRDYHFKHLFSSTLHQSEIDMSTQYNREAVSFQYDFLNDDIDVNPNSDPRDLKMPKELFEALKSDRPIIFYTNPPYGQSGSGGDKHKAGISQNRVASIMRREKLGHASSELYTNFIYRVQKLAKDFRLSNVFFFFFNKGFLTSPAFGNFTHSLLDQFKFNNGFMLNAGEFQGTSSNWGIIFSNFELKTDASPRQSRFTFDIKRSNNNGEIEKIKEHTLINVDNVNTLNAWLGEVEVPKQEYNGGKYPRYTGGFNLTKGKTARGTLREGAIGYLESDGLLIQRADKYCSLNSSILNTDNGWSVIPENFERCCITFAIKKSILPDASWINDKDVFRRPSEEFQSSAKWSEFVKDSVVFSLFHRSSYQTSLRHFEFNGEFYDVKNEWFFMSRDEIIKLATKYDLNEVVFDARNAGEERYVYRYLHTENAQKIELSDEARELLLAGEEFVRATFLKRFLTAQDHPEWHLMTWDAGYYQAYKIYTANKDNEKISTAYQYLDEARTKLETKIRKQVYRDHILEK